MKKFKIIDLGISYDAPLILRGLSCPEDNPNHEAYETRLHELIEENRGLLSAAGYALQGQGEADSGVFFDQVLYCIVSLGPSIDRKIKELFGKHEYLDAMLLNGGADHILYEATGKLYGLLKNMTEGKYLTHRYEPGNCKVPMTMQKKIVGLVNDEFAANFQLSSGLMISPQKTLAYFYGLTDSEEGYGIDHDCSACTSVDCKFRKNNV